MDAFQLFSSHISFVQPILNSTTGTDKTGKKVEIYFDPATGRAIESK